jgi:hypothetical protein
MYILIAGAVGFFVALVIFAIRFKCIPPLKASLQEFLDSI